MTIGLGILLIVIGAIIEWVVQVNIPGIDRYMLGWILMGAGVVISVLALIFGAMRGRSTTVNRVQDSAGNVAVNETGHRGTDIQ